MGFDSVLVFFCVGTTTLIAILRSLTQQQFIPPLDLIAQSFPAAAPFYVGWCACFPSLIILTGLGILMLWYSGVPVGYGRA